MRVDIGIFAHNEAAGIAATLGDCLDQDIWTDANLDVRMVVLANGCTDATASVSKEIFAQAGRPGLEVFDLEQGGKSRTWNRFVHEIARPDSDYLIFCDADIRMPDKALFSKLLGMISADARLAAVPSKPVKDITANPGKLSLTDKIILAGAGGLGDWKKAICGQLYIARGEVMRRIWCPIGLPVEDGFLRAMILTDNLCAEEDLDRIDGRDDCAHIYESERKIGALIRHQVRIVIGGAVNRLIFERVREEPAPARGALLQASASDEHWLPTLIRTRVPRLPDGWVPVHFLFKRVHAFRSNGRMRPGPLLKLMLGLGFDATVYALAQARMARGSGANFW